MNADVFGVDRPLVGMVHLPPLPGAPEFDGDRAAVRDRALADARALAAGGVDGVLVENFGDAPYYPDEVPAHVVASMTSVVGRVCDAVDLPVGVNVLRNDAGAAVSVAAATGARFVRVNVHAGARVTDQGVVEGRAHETLRLRDRLDADVRVLADVAVKHSSALGPERPVAAAAAELVERGLADGVIVTGARTGRAVGRPDLEAVTAALSDAPAFVGSGVTPETAPDLLAVGDGAIVGTALKTDGDVRAPVDIARVRALVEAVRG
ncbi:MAG: BtpA/SgcQ family protein [Haloarculaceae archaeon]